MQDIHVSSLNISLAQHLSDLVHQYNKVFGELIDKHSPLKRRTITVWPNSKWYTEELRAEKRKKRQLERKYRYTKLEVDKEICITHCKTIHIMIPVAKRNYYSNLIQESSGDQTKLFRYQANSCTQKLKINYPPMPPLKSSQIDFHKFLMTKSQKLDVA